jgi:uncharacterized glyoxalase superfamily protein PhnB
MSQNGSPIIPCLSYKDPNAAIDWLCRAFGFQVHAAYKDDAGTVMHAELILGNSMIMVGPSGTGVLASHLATPAKANGLCTQVVYVIVEDTDAHYAKAKAEGAKIVLELEDKDYGGRDYCCRDSEGNLWSFGTYNPWTAGGNE